jgi:hypothetical protein
MQDGLRPGLRSRRTGTVGDSIRSSKVAMASHRACSAVAAMIASGIRRAETRSDHRIAATVLAW